MIKKLPYLLTVMLMFGLFGGCKPPEQTEKAVPKEEAVSGVEETTEEARQAVLEETKEAVGEETPPPSAESAAESVTQREQGVTEQPKETTPEEKGAQEESAVIETQWGKIVLRFFEEDAPGHVANFKKLTKEGFYDGTTFHRVIPGFMIQGGDPLSKDDNRMNDGTGGPGYTIKAEFNSRPHLRGTLSMARSNDPNSAGSQFFICVAPAPFLDGKYTVFGEVVEGMEVADQIVNLPRDPRDNPLQPAVMKKVYLTASTD